MRRAQKKKSDAYVNDCEGDGEVTGVTLLRDDVAKSTNGRDGVVREGQSLRRCDRRNNVCQERDTPISCRGEISTKVTANVCGSTKSIGRA